MRDRIRGLYDLPTGEASNMGRRINAALRNLAYLRMMGGVVPSSISDMGKVVMTEGFIRAFGGGYAKVVRNLHKLDVLKADVEYAGIGADTIISGRVEALADINNYALGNTAVERGIQYLADRFGNVSGMNQWNDIQKLSHAFAMQTNVYDGLVKGKGTSKVVDKLKRLGLTDDDIARIKEKLIEHSSSVETGARLFHPKKWGDDALAFKWAAALRKESDRVIIVPGQEKPLFMSRTTFQTILQFRSFMVASTQRTMLAALQGQEANVLGGILTMISLGSMSYVFHQWNADRPISEDPRQWLIEGIDRSGSLGILMEINNTVEQLSANRIGLRPAVGVSEPASRFAVRQQSENFLGPTYGSGLVNVLRLGSAGTGGEWKESDTSNLRRLLPYQNLFYLRKGVERVERAAHYGITGESL
jgi:hypothetical protein